MKNKFLILAVIFALSLIALYFFCYSEIVPATDSGYFPVAHGQLKNAKSKIHIIMFKMEFYSDYPDSHANQLLDDLVSAKEKGVDVKVILEGGEDYLKGFTNRYACEYLKENGISVKYDPEGVTTHAKLVIVDNAIILGSTNWNFYSLDRNHETDVLIKSVAVANHFEQYFDNLWKSSKETTCSRKL